MLRNFRYASITRWRICLPTRSSSRKSLIATHRRRISAPLSLITSCGWIDVAERLRHLAAVDVDQEAVRQHLAERRRARACPARRAASSGTSRGAGRCLRDRCRPATSGRRGRGARPRGSTPSRTTRRECRARARTPCRRTTGTRGLAGRNSSIGRSYHASAPYSSNTEAARSTSAAGHDGLAARWCSRRPGSAHPRRAGARCTSRGGSTAC